MYIRDICLNYRNLEELLSKRVVFGHVRPRDDRLDHALAVLAFTHTSRVERDDGVLEREPAVTKQIQRSKNAGHTAENSVLLRVPVRDERFQIDFALRHERNCQGVVSGLQIKHWKQN